MASLWSNMKLSVSHGCLPQFGLECLRLFDLKKPVLDVLNTWFRLLFYVLLINTLLVVLWLHGYALFFDFCLNLVCWNQVLTKFDKLLH